MAEDCPICMEPTARESQCALKCGHMLCNRCITLLENPICPVCREPIFPGRPPPGHSAPGSSSISVENDDAATQIEEDAQLARRLASETQDEVSGEARAQLLRERYATPVTMAEAQQFHHIGSRMTYSTF